MYEHIRKYSNAIAKHGITPPQNNIVYYDNVIGGPRTKNILEGIVFSFDQRDSYIIEWDRKSLSYLLCILDAELSGDFESCIKGITFENISYLIYNEVLIDAICLSKTNHARIYGDESSVLGASIWIRYIEDKKGLDIFNKELITNYVNPK